MRCWEIQANGSSVPKAMQAHEQPVLCSAWNADGSTVYSGGCDNTVKAWNLATNQQQVGALAWGAMLVQIWDSGSLETSHPGVLRCATETRGSYAVALQVDMAP